MFLHSHRLRPHQSFSATKRFLQHLNSILALCGYSRVPFCWAHVCPSALIAYLHSDVKLLAGCRFDFARQQWRRQGVVLVITRSGPGGVDQHLLRGEDHLRRVHPCCDSGASHFLSFLRVVIVQQAGCRRTGGRSQRRSFSHLPRSSILNNVHSK